MHPLHSVLKWWDSLDGFPRWLIAAEVCFHLTDHTDVMEKHGALFRNFLEQHLSANRHIGRAIAVRATIDYIFTTTNLEASLQRHLENVEGANQVLKRASNAAIARHSKAAPEWKTAQDKWRLLKRKALSDKALVTWERACLTAAIRRRLL
jgi:hypothetical protein